MNLQAKIKIDKLIGIPMVALLSIVCRVQRMFRKNRNKKSVQRIAICKLMGMGSIIQSTPLLQTLKKKYPEAELIFITSGVNVELLREIHPVNTIWLIRDDGFFALLNSILKLVKNFLQKRIDLYFDLEVYSWFSVALSALSDAQQKFGLNRQNSRLRSAVYDEWISYNSNLPVSEVYLQMAKMIPMSERINSLYDFYDLQNGNPLFYLSHLNAPFIVVNVNASELRVERRWGNSNFAQLINIFAKQFPQYSIVLTGSKNEKEYVSEVIQQIELQYQKRIVDTSAQLSIPQFIQLLSRCELMITNDSGPMHIAFALNIHVVALFGPCSPDQYKVSENAIVIYQKVHCSPCVHLYLTPPCGGDNQCMKRISVQEVFSEVKNIFSATLLTHDMMGSNKSENMNAEENLKI